MGVEYDDNMVAQYKIADNEKDCEKFRGSKYVAANINNVRKEIKDKLE